MSEHGEVAYLRRFDVPGKVSLSHRLPVHKLLRTRQRTLNPPNPVTGWLRDRFEPVSRHDQIVALVTKPARRRARLRAPRAR